MTIKLFNQGSISLLNDIRAEFGGPTTNISLFAYRAGGAYVPNGTLGYPGPSGVADPIDTVGPLGMNEFYGASAISYSIVPSQTNLNEGQGILYTITTVGVPNGTVLYWTVAGSVSSADIGGGFTSGSVTISGGTASFIITFLNDSLTEGPENIVVQLRTGSVGGPIVANSASSTINDTSTTPTVFNFNDVVSSNLTGGYNLRNRALTAGWNGTAPLAATITVNSGIYVVGTLFASAFTTSTTPGSGPGGMPVGSTITLTNNGIIAGLGGVGGNGGSVTNASMTNGSVGGQGGTAFSPNHSINVYNYGTIGGGGGGGGGGGAKYLIDTFSDKSGTYTSYYAASGGGGGGGRANGVIGVNGTPIANAGTSQNFAYGPDSPASSGTFAAPGAGSSSGNVGPFGPDNMQGGAGGNLGQPGFPGGPGGGEQTANSSSGAGGAAGAAIIGGANILWFAFGARLGSIDNPGTNMLPGGIAGPQTFFAASGWFGGGSGTAFAHVSFQGNGNIELVEGTTFAVATPQDAGDWYSPVSSGIGSAYWVRVTRTSGTALGYVGPALGVWNSLSSNAVVRHEVNVGGFNSLNTTYNIAIATDSVGSNILVNHTVTINIDTEL